MVWARINNNEATDLYMIRNESVTVVRYWDEISLDLMDESSLIISF